MKKKWRNFFRVLMISPAPVLFPTEQEKYEAYEQSLTRQPNGMPAPLLPEGNPDESLPQEYPTGNSSDPTGVTDAEQGSEDDSQQAKP